MVNRVTFDNLNRTKIINVQLLYNNFPSPHNNNNYIYLYENGNIKKSFFDINYEKNPSPLPFLPLTNI